MSRIPVDLGPAVLDIKDVKPGDYFYIYNPPYPPQPNPRPLYEKFQVESVEEEPVRVWDPFNRGWIVNGTSDVGPIRQRIHPGNRMVQAIYFVNPKPMQKAVGEVFTRLTNISSKPGRGGPPQVVRKFLGVDPKISGGRRTRNRSRKMKRNRRSRRKQ